MTTDDDGRKSALKLTFSGVRIDTKPSDHYVDGDWKTIMFAPLWVYETVAGIDKKVEEKERAAFVAALREPPASQLVGVVFSQALETLTTLEAERRKDKRDPMRGLGEVEALLARYPNAADAGTFRRALVDLANRVASSSGGGLFGFGSKVSDEEASAIERIRRLFNVSAG